MNYRVEFEDDFMHVLDDDNHGHDAFVIDPAQPAAARAALAKWITEYDVDPDAIDELEQWLVPHGRIE